MLDNLGGAIQWDFALVNEEVEDFEGSPVSRCVVERVASVPVYDELRRIRRGESVGVELAEGCNVVVL